MRSKSHGGSTAATIKLTKTTPTGNISVVDKGQETNTILQNEILGVCADCRCSASAKLTVINEPAMEAYGSQAVTAVQEL